MWRLISIIAYAYGNYCPLFSCASDSPTTGQCISYTTSSGQSTYQVTPCQNGLECLFASETSSYCQYPSQCTRNPGEYCFNNFDCISNNCNKGTCSGLKTGSPCYTTSQCAQGAYCDPSSHLCTSQLETSSPCTLTEQCLNGLVCNFGTCIEIFSLSNNIFTDVPVSVNGFNIACKSGYAAVIDATTFNCTSPPISPKVLTKPIPCDSSNICFAADGVTNASCVCDYFGDSYCPLFVGDQPVQELIIQWTGIITDSQDYCHTLNRWGYECFYNIHETTNFENYLEWLALYQQFFNNTWVTLASQNSPCINQTLLQSFLNVQSEQKQTYSCPVYTCTNYTSGWESSVCIIYNDDIVYSNVLPSIIISNNCTEDEYCYASSTEISSNQTCSPLQSQLRNPGELCEDSSNCTTGLCLGGLCRGAAQGGECETEECNPGLYCNSTGFCVETIENGQKCSADSECATFSACVNNFCVLRYSLPVGFVTAFRSQGSLYGYAESCQTGFATTVNGSVVCAVAPVSSQNSQQQCLTASFCTDSTGNYTKNCVCGYQNNQFCPSFEGDSYLQNAIKNYKILSSFGAFCSQVGLNPLCINKIYVLTYYYYSTNFTAYQNFDIVNAQSCIQEVFQPEYVTGINYINDQPGPKPPPVPIPTPIVIDKAAFLAFGLIVLLPFAV